MHRELSPSRKSDARKRADGAKRFGAANIMLTTCGWVCWQVNSIGLASHRWGWQCLHRCSTGMAAELKTVTNRLALGTAQLGMQYGVANRTGQPDLEVATRIVSTARQAGIRYFDTAQAYGKSETVLGSVFQRIGTGDVAVVTKLPTQLDTTDADAILRGI